AQDMAGADGPTSRAGPTAPRPAQRPRARRTGRRPGSARPPRLHLDVDPLLRSLESKEAIEDRKHLRERIVLEDLDDAPDPRQELLQAVDQLWTWIGGFTFGGEELFGGPSVAITDVEKPVEGIFQFSSPGGHHLVRLHSQRLHRYGSSITVGSSAASSRQKRSSRIRDCCSGRPASPSGLPKGKRTYAARGAFMASVISGRRHTLTVDIPRPSSSAWTSPTDR